MCDHPLPKNPSKIDTEVVDVNEYGKYQDSVGSPKVKYSYVCPNCGTDVKATRYADIRKEDIDETNLRNY